ncbi:hypothetical protein TrST_g11644 [Triparma strigata]|uniref:25S rRNA (uridine-N(3))-methyltransferase BMT5-like domain-containing protein n=1 Tax=Triparma strigata TaxID=1606541 RepID=A0A9W7ELK9_9STRA|nr:hypothetical protein TrST_g11644 [Triparma strigata]
MPPSIASILGLHPLPSSSNVLFLGEGDFTFSASLLKSLTSGTIAGGTSAGGVSPLPPTLTFTVTSYDTLSTVLKKYPLSSSSLSTLSEYNIKPLHSIDALNLPPTPPYDKIIWMFPHTGHQRVHLNRHLLFNFFKNLTSLSPKGLVYISLSDCRPYSDWRLESSATFHGYETVKKVYWDSKSLEGYKHVTTLGGEAYRGVNGVREGKGVGCWVYGFRFVGGEKEEEKVETIGGGYEVRVGDSDDDDVVEGEESIKGFDEEVEEVEKEGKKIGEKEKKRSRSAKREERKKKKRSRNERRKIARKKAKT